MKLVASLLAGLVLGACTDPEGSTGRSDASHDVGAETPDSAPADGALTPEDRAPSDVGRDDGGPDCASRCERSTDCGGAGWQCVREAVPGCSGRVGLCRHDCRRYRGDTASDEICCEGATRAEMSCTAERGWECLAASTRHTPASTGTFSATLFSCGALAAEAEVGVACGSLSGEPPCVPPLSCCFTITNICDAGERACYARHECDGPEDCGTGVCCGEPSRSYDELGSSAANPISTRCSAEVECVAPNVRLCNEDADCPSPHRCCAERHGGRIGLCAPQCPGG